MESLMNIFNWQLSLSFPTPNSLFYVVDPEVTSSRFQYILMIPICTVWNTPLIKKIDYIYSAESTWT